MIGKTEKTLHFITHESWYTISTFVYYVVRTLFCMGKQV